MGVSHFTFKKNRIKERVLFFVNSFEQLQDTGTIFLQFTKSTTPRPTETGKIPKAFE